MDKKLLMVSYTGIKFSDMIGSDNGPTFVSKVSQDVTKLIGAEYKFYCTHRPQHTEQIIKKDIKMDLK